MRWVAGLVLGAIWLWPAGAAWAAGPANGVRGFVVSPAFQQVDVPGGQSAVQYNLKVRNQTETGQNFRLSVVDFGALDEQGGVAFLGQPANELEHKYGLASWMRLERDALYVAPGETVAVGVTIENRPTLAPGGHYGAVLVTAVTETGEAQPNQVGVKQVISSLVLASKQGGEQRSLSLDSVVANLTMWRLPGAVEHRFQNSGNVHLIPRGVVEVRDPRGKVVARGAINEASGAILPESFRRYKTRLTTVGRGWLPGRYELRTTYRYDGTEETRVAVKRFWYAGQVVVWLTLVLALVAAGGFAWWFWRRQGWRLLRR